MVTAVVRVKTAADFAHRGDDFVWSTMIDIARACEDTETLPHIEELRRYFTIERSPYT